MELITRTVDVFTRSRIMKRAFNISFPSNPSLHHAVSLQLAISTANMIDHLKSRKPTCTYIEYEEPKGSDQSLKLTFSLVENVLRVWFGFFLENDARKLTTI